MTDSKFRFKQFEVNQSHCAMKIGTDSVLLGAWMRLPQQGNILDIGTGTGILSLMAAQRTTNTHITALEIDSDAAQQASENIANSPWHDRISVSNQDFTQWAVSCKEKYESIISNPPFFEQSLLPPDTARCIARHTETLTYAQIFDLSRKLIKDEGYLSLVLPANLYERTNETAQLYGWGITRLTYIRTTAHKNAKRVLCEWQQHHIAPCTPTTLTIHDIANKYSQEYIELTRDFYLHL